MRQQKISYAGQTSQITQNYTYDMLNRLKSATETVSGNTNPTWKQTFNYDIYGNRRFDAANTTTLPANNGIYNPNIGADNKFLVSEGYNYDSEGNLTSNPESQLFQYDAENRQTEVTNSALNTSANYQYDGSGKRVRKTFGNEETIFVYDAFGKMVAEYSNIIETRPKSVSYLTTDALGSPRIITDQTGQVVSRHDYMPFGEEVMANVGGRTTVQGYAGNDGVKQQFTGYERDGESGLDYAQARYFSSKHGRFTSVDPLTASANIKSPQTLNRYSYGNNSPYKFVDPLGLKSVPNRGCQGGQNCMGSGQGYDEAELGEDTKVTVTKNASELSQKDFNKALAKNIFERASQGYIDDSGGMTTSMYDATTTYENINEFLAANGVSAAEYDASDLPSFSSLVKNYPTSDFQSLKQQYDNQCAIRMSYALQKAGVDMSDFTQFVAGGVVAKLTENGKTYNVVLRAYQLWDYIYAKFGNASKDNYFYSTNQYSPNGEKDYAKKMSDVQGIILFREFWGAGQGHIDYWTGTACGHCQVFGPDSYFDRSKTIIVLDLTYMVKRP